jgi:broad specificity phosphatase PhoE
LIRHGETEGAEKRRYKGSIDVPLSGNGVRQIRKVSEYIAQLVQDSLTSESSRQAFKPPAPPPRKGSALGLLNAVYCSDLSRARASAEIIARPHSRIPVVMGSLRERNFGIWEGMRFDEIREKYPDEFDAWAGNPLKFCPMGGESTSEVRKRVIEALDKIVADNTGESIAVVSHGGVNRIILCHVLGVPLENIFRVEQDYGALNIIEFWDRYPVVKLMNGKLNE